MTKVKNMTLREKQALYSELRGSLGEGERLTDAGVPIGPTHPTKDGKGFRVSIKISDKGAVSVRAGGKFPTTLYKEQWRRVLSCVNEIEEFISANESKLASKAA